MTPVEVIQAFREDMDDLVEPRLWSDAQLAQYLDAAQKMFCRLVGGLSDATSEITRITVPAAAKFVAISPLILKLRAVTTTDTRARDISILNHEDVQFKRETLTGTGGIIRTVVTGMDENKLRVCDPPLVDTTLDLLVYRLPLTSITPATLATDTLEIGEQHHPYLLWYMEYLALLKQDAESFDKAKGAEKFQQFAAYCDQAKGEKSMREHKFRVTGYGGI